MHCPSSCPTLEYPHCSGHSPSGRTRRQDRLVDPKQGAVALSLRNQTLATSCSDTTSCDSYLALLLDNTNECLFASLITVKSMSTNLRIMMTFRHTSKSTVYRLNLLLKRHIRNQSLDFKEERKTSARTCSMPTPKIDCIESPGWVTTSAYHEGSDQTRANLLRDEVPFNLFSVISGEIEIKSSYP